MTYFDEIFIIIPVFTKPGRGTNILSYNDVAAISEYAIPAMQWACGTGIIESDANGNLNPYTLATRAYTVHILMRAMEVFGI